MEQLINDLSNLKNYYQQTIRLFKGEVNTGMFQGMVKDITKGTTLDVQDTLEWVMDANDINQEGIEVVIDPMESKLPVLSAKEFVELYIEK